MVSYAILLVLVLPVLVAGRAGKKGRFPVMGWNTWCTQNDCGVDWCSSKEVLDVATTIKSTGLLAVGYDHILLDDCWGLRNTTTKQIIGDPARFPEGMKAFIAKIHTLGFKFGLYTDIGPEGCHHPYAGSYGHYKDDAKTFQDWAVDYVKFDGCDQPRGHTPEELTCNMSQTLLDTGTDFWFNFHCWHTETCATCGTSFRVDHDHHDDWDNTKSVIDFLQTRQPFWGPDPAQGWPDPDFIYTGGQGCSNVDPGPDAGAGHGPSPAGQRCPHQTEDEYITEFTIWTLAGGQLVFATDPRNMSAFQKKVWFNTELIEVFNDTKSFQDIAMISKTKMKAAVPLSIDAGSAVADFPCALKSGLSKHACTINHTFTCDATANTMTATDGCRGIFICGTATSVLNDAMSSKSNTVPCVNSPPPPPSPSPGPAPPAEPQVWARPTSDGGAAIALFNAGTDAVQMTVTFADVPVRTWTASTSLKVRDMWTHTDNGTAIGSFSATVPSHGTVAIKLMP